jgi:cytochrome c oxidase cbb3-type subunit 2
MNSGPLLFLGLFATMACSWTGFILAPQLQLGGLTQTNTVVVGDASLSNLSAGPAGRSSCGAEIYRANGCAACHTEMVRPPDLGSDIQRGWGARRSLAEDYLFEQPVMLGSQRIGPDLANFGRRSDTTNGIYLRLYDPRLITPGSVMPPYRFLFENPQDRAFPSPTRSFCPIRTRRRPGLRNCPAPGSPRAGRLFVEPAPGRLPFEAPPPPMLCQKQTPFRPTPFRPTPPSRRQARREMNPDEPKKTVHQNGPEPVAERWTVPMWLIVVFRPPVLLGPAFPGRERRRL